MIAAFTLSRGRRVRLWRDECPLPAYAITGTLHRTLPAAGVATAAARIVVEASVPKGPMAMYGLLGAEYRPLLDRETVEVDVPYGASAGTPFESTIAVRSEQPVVGLPEEFAAAVAAGAEAALRETGAIGPGLLTIDCAAHGEAGSNAVIFGSLARALVVLLGQPPGDEAELVEGVLP